MKSNLHALLLIAVSSTFGFHVSSLFAQGTAFTYQGQLQNNGSPANGFYDFNFLLSNAAIAGSQVGSTVTNLNVGVTNGLFTTTLDFGAVFAGNPAWLAISVRSNGTGGYVSLTPLQPLMPTPYAIFANTASNLSGTVGPASVSGLYSNAVTLNNAANQLSGAFSGNGSGLTSLNPANLGAGTAGINISGNAATATSAGTATTAATATTANNFSGALGGNVTGTQGATVVSTVGGQTAASIASGVIAANSATSANTPNTIVARDASGNISAGIVSATSFLGTVSGDGSGLTNIPVAALQAVPLTNTQTGVTLSGTFSGTGSGLTSLNPASLGAGTAAINISGNAATATSATAATTAATATTATTATTANNFSGALAGNVTGTQSATVVSSVGGETAASIASGVISANAATSANTPSTIVARDASGNLSAGIVTAASFLGAVNGDGSGLTNIPVAALQAVPLTNTQTGVTLSGTFSGNGSGLTSLNPASLGAGTAGINISGSAATATSATTASTATTATSFSGSLAGDVTGTQGATVVSTVGGQTAANVASGAIAANAATSANTPNAIVARDGSGNLSAGTITATSLLGAITGDGAGLTNIPFAGLQGVPLTNTQTGVILDGTFTGIGSGLTGLNPASLGAGTAAINISGLAATATSATTASSANTATSFSGSLAGDVTGTQGATVVSTVGGQTAASVASGAIAANAATSANTPNAIVARDGSGNLSAGNITATSLLGAVTGDGAGLTNIPLAGLQTVPLTNTQIGVTLNGTFTGNGSGLTNVSVATLSIPAGMALIPAGVFTMGNSIGDPDIVDAVPVTVNVSAFYMDLNSVSFSQWRSVYHWATNSGYDFANVGAGKAPNHPVHSVDWFDAVKWCNARSQLVGKTPVYYTDAGLTEVYTNGEILPYVNWSAQGYRLPTEAEWEKAARGGRSGQRFPWANVIDQSVANYESETTNYSYDLGPTSFNPSVATGSTPYTSPMSYFAANDYGLFDMAGNVWAWCWDWYDATYAGGTDPKGPATGSLHVLRGGSWGDTPNFSRTANRFYTFPEDFDYYVGFRCVLSSGQ